MTTRELLLSCWQLDPIALAVIVAAGAALVATRGRRPSLRALPLGLAIVVLVVALLSPVGRLADGYLFSAHMLQHLLLVLAVPPLAWLGFQPHPPGPPPRKQGGGDVSEASTGMDDPRAGAPLALLAGRGAGGVGLACWALGVGAMWLWHAPTLCNAASSSPLVHRFQELSLLAMGAAFWWPVMAPRVSARLSPLGGIVYLFTACSACTLLGIFITFSPVQVCSVFAHPVDALGVMPLLREGWGLTPERDQQVGGLLMWVPACLVYGAGIMAQLARLLHEPQRTAAEGRAS